MAMHIFAIFVLLPTMFKYSLSVIVFPKNDSTWGLFKQFQTDFERRYYSNEEELFRFGMFKNTVDKIAKLNSDPNDMATYAINDFADETEEEKRMRRGRLPIRHRDDFDTNPYGDWDGVCTSCARFPELAYPTPPPSLNWTRMGAVTPVVQQGKCGNCWAYGATGDVEGAWFLSGHRLTVLSHQQLTSCDHVGDDTGCLGGSTCMDSFKYIMNNGGLASQKDYPDCSSYFNCPGDKPRVGTCNKKLASTITAWINGSYTVSGGSYRYHPKPVSEVRLKEVLTKTGPITIGINAEYFDYYFGGIMYQGSDNCPTGWNNLDHQVLLTGYGVEDGYNYWVVKNTWGTRWGEAGYARVIYGINCCGIATDASHSYINRTKKLRSKLFT